MTPQLFSHHYSDAPFHESHFLELDRRILKLKTKEKTVRARLEAARNQRLIVGLLWLGFAVTFMARSDWGWSGIFTILFFPLFLFVVRGTNRWQMFLKRILALESFYERQKLRVSGHPQTHQMRKPFLEPQKNSDISILGERSLLALLDETFSDEAQSRLTLQLSQGLDSIQAVQVRHDKIQSLHRYSSVCRRWCIEGALNTEAISLSQLSELLASSLTRPNYKWWALAHAVLFPGYLAVFVTIGEGYLKAPLALPIVIYAVFSLSSLKALVAAFRQGEILERSLSSLLPILSFAERKPKVFAKEMPSLKTNGFSSSLNTLKRYVSFLSIQSHGLAYIIVNALTPWTFFWTGLTEVWRRKNHQSTLNILNEVRETEIAVSLCFFYHYQSRTLPTFTSQALEMTTEAAFHPLIDRAQVVANSVSLNADQSVLLLTGSNMSGKSTFMRTLAVNQTLALAGAPVFAKSFQTSWAPVLTCMQVQDSLSDGYSYFFAEVKRVKEILDHVASGAPAFFFVDEIFKGTNNRERLIGSKAIIGELSSMTNARGIVSTHDLELAGLASEKSHVQNFHFRDEVSENALVFSYRIHPGPCPTTNALKIMRAQGLPVPQG